jgi:hypothetical protein
VALQLEQVNFHLVLITLQAVVAVAQALVVHNLPAV